MHSETNRMTTRHVMMAPMVVLIEGEMFPDSES